MDCSSYSRIGDFGGRFYPIYPEIKDTTDTDRSASDLDLHLEIESERLWRTQIYDKRDGIHFLIENFPFICNNIPAVPACWMYIFQLILYSRACGTYMNFLDRGLLLKRKLLNQRFPLVKSSLRKFYSRHHDLIGNSVSQITTIMFHLSQTLSGPFLNHDLSSGL